MPSVEVRVRRAGRPRALNEEQAAAVWSLYQTGYGYRAIAREIGKQGTMVSWSTVRRIIKNTRKANQDTEAKP